MPRTDATTNPDPAPDTTGAGSTRLGSAAADVAGAAVRFAMPAAVIALAVFFALQWTRIQLWHRIAAEQRLDSTHPLSPAFIARYGGWFERGPMTSNRSLRFSGLVYARDIQRAQRIWVAEVLSASFLASFAWAMVLAGLIVLVVARSRAVPYELPLAVRARMAGRALRSAWVWSAAAAVASAAAVWHIGFDRDGGSRAIGEGVLPSAAQGLVMLGVWGVLGAVAAVAFVRPALRDGGPSKDLLVCARCRYRVQGVRAGACPECDAPIPAHDPGSLPSARTVHRVLVRWSSRGAALVAIVLGVVAVSSQRCADWLRLRPTMTSWVNSPACRVAADRPAHLRTIYGAVTLSAMRRGENAATGGAWIVSWSLEPNRGAAAAMPRSGTFSVSPPPISTGPALRHDTPFGPLWWWVDENGSSLVFGYTPTIVRDVRP